MGRRAKPETRDHQLNLRLTAREYNLICARATAARMRPVEYGRLQLLMERSVKITQTAASAHLDPLFMQQLSRIGNNLNQITRRLHQFEVTAPPALDAVL